MTPFDDFRYLINSILLGEEPVGSAHFWKIIWFFFYQFVSCFQTIEDFILLVGTFVAFVAFVLWCCFPIAPKEVNTPSHYEDWYTQYKKNDNSDSD